MPTLTIQLPGLPPVSHVLKDETVTIGRFKGNTIVIEDASISLMHAKITRKDGQFYLKDLNSTNGTIVNGQPIGEVRLRDQDRVRFAEITTQFLAEGEAVTMGATAAPIAASAPPAARANVAAVQATAAPSQTEVSPKVPSGPASKPRSKIPVRTLALAASVLVVALGGAGIAVWKFVGSKGKSSEVAALTRSFVSKKANNTEPATQIVAARPSVEAKSIPERDETAPAPALNIRELVVALKSKEVTERRQAASALHGAGADAKAAIPELKAALKDSDQEVQMWAALALVNNQTYDKAVIPILVLALKNDNTVLRQVACLSLGLIPYEAGDKDAVIPALNEAATKDVDEDVRQAAKAALNIVGAEGTESAAK